MGMGTGEYFDNEDYAGLFRRLGAMVIDSVALFVLGIVLWNLVSIIAFSIERRFDPTGVFYFFWAVFVWLYLVLLKRSKWRTLGYRLFRLQIVSIRGGTPGVLAMTFRLLLWLFGPFNLLFDLVWMGADSESQSLRDCYAGTYVVRNGAQAAGVGQVHLSRYHAAGMTLAYPRVMRGAG